MCYRIIGKEGRGNQSGVGKGIGRKEEDIETEQG